MHYNVASTTYEPTSERPCIHSVLSTSYSSYLLYTLYMLYTTHYALYHPHGRRTCIYYSTHHSVSYLPGPLALLWCCSTTYSTRWLSQIHQFFLRRPEGPRSPEIFHIHSTFHRGIVRVRVRVTVE